MRYGVKAALSDAWTMAGLDVDLLEVHLNVDDIPRRREALVSTFGGIRSDLGLDLVVHAPEFMLLGGRPVLLDPSSHDDDIRSLSLFVLGSTIELAGELDALLLVAHPGGIFPSADDPAAEGGLDRLVGSLRELRDMAQGPGLPMTIENMPWFYLRKAIGGGKDERWESTIMVHPEDMEVLATEVDGMTLDVSHGFLHSPEGGMEAIEGFLDDHREAILHLHLSDALPPDHEGLQVGEGSVDFASVLSAFTSSDVSAVPEVIGGHRGGGVGFRRALEELRRIASAME